MPRTQRFSERHDIVSQPLVQSDDIDRSLRIGLWNAFYGFHRTLKDKLNEYRANEGRLAPFFLHYWKFLSWPIDTIPDYFSKAMDRLKQYVLKAEWHEVYDLIDSAANGPEESVREWFCECCNRALEENLSAFRFVGTQLTRLSSEEEIEAVSEALARTDKISGTRMHLKTAIELYSDRTSPDYRNSIKESISAVESICQFVSNKPKATLGDALKSLRKKHKIHPALNTAFDKLYGYTSNSDGIRHGVLEEGTIDCADAQFMLVACSAFINYVLAKSE